MASSCKTDRPSPLKTLFELLAIIWLAFWFFGLPAGAFYYCWKYALPKALDFSLKACEGRPHSIFLLPFYLLFEFGTTAVYIGPAIVLLIFLYHEIPLINFVVDVAEFLWEAPFLKKEFWVGNQSAKKKSSSSP